MLSHYCLYLYISTTTTVGKFAEEDRLVTYLGAGLGGVVGVVEPDADDLLRVGDGGEQPHAGGVEGFAVGQGRRGAAEPLVAEGQNLFE